jgi:hypothetical protein
MAKTLLPEIMEKSKEMYQDHDLKGLTWDDLVLVLESYKNMITLNTTLLERQQKVIELEEELLKLSTLKKKELDEIKLSLESYVKLYELNGSERDSTLTKEFLKVQTDFIKLTEKVTRIYIVVGAIVIPLIGLVVLLLSHMK